MKSVTENLVSEVRDNETVMALVDILSDCNPEHLDEIRNKLATVIISKNRDRFGDRDVVDFGIILGEAIDRILDDH